MKTLKTFIYIIIEFCLFISCNTSAEITYKEHIIKKYDIDPYNKTEPITKNLYSIDSICPLQFPNGLDDIQADKIHISNGRIYFLDSKVSRKLYVFNQKGELMHKLGIRGRAKNEFIGQPDDFFIDCNNYLHIFDKLGHKIIVFNEDGRTKKIIDTNNYYPHSFGLTYNNRYMMYFHHGHKEGTEKEKYPSLLSFDSDFNSYDELMFLNKDFNYVGTGFSFFQNGKRLSHIPILSDSVIVFSNDTIEKVVLFDFNGSLSHKNKRGKSKQVNEISSSTDKNGESELIRYEESNSLIYLNYIYQMSGMNWLYNKKNGQMLNGLNLFEGINPYSYYFLNDDQIIAYVDKETVERLKQFYERKTFRENLKKSPIQLKELLEGKINAPALFFISLK